jgi:hypothetical protein
MERREFFLRGKQVQGPTTAGSPGTDVEMPNGTTLAPYFVVDVRCGGVYIAAIPHCCLLPYPISILQGGSWLAEWVTREEG